VKPILAMAQTRKKPALQRVAYGIIPTLPLLGPARQESSARPGQ
jgi:hypothetical protein